MARSWGFWTRYKLELLQRYLDAFTTATKSRSSTTVYLDLFGGESENFDRDTKRPIEGSAVIALNTNDPAFTHLYFFELDLNATKLRKALEEDYRDRNWKIYPGDSNETIYRALAELKAADADWAPTFAFIDPNGPHYSWRTIEALAAHKPARIKTKVELWMLFPDPLFTRLLPRSGEVRPTDSKVITEMFGDPGWHSIWKARLDHEIEPRDAREEYVNLMRWRLEQDLGYRWTHQLEIRNAGGTPLYHMIFATDSEPGSNIMTHLYNKAASEFPAMAQTARAHRGRLKREARGQHDLFPDLDSSLQPRTSITSNSEELQKLYHHEPPDAPRQHDASSCPYCT